MRSRGFDLMSPEPPEAATEVPDPPPSDLAREEAGVRRMTAAYDDDRDLETFRCFLLDCATFGLPLPPAHQWRWREYILGEADSPNYGPMPDEGWPL